jgi:hypothetical protein
LNEQEGTKATRNNFLFSLPSSFSQAFFAMHPLFIHASAITHEMIGAAIVLHKDKWTGGVKLDMLVIARSRSGLSPQSRRRQQSDLRFLRSLVFN